MFSEAFLAAATSVGAAGVVYTAGDDDDHADVPVELVSRTCMTRLVFGPAAIVTDVVTEIGDSVDHEPSLSFF